LYFIDHKSRTHLIKVPLLIHSTFVDRRLKLLSASPTNMSAN